MAYWLFKSEPEAWSWHDQVAKGAAGEEWTGVRNHTAKLNMIAMKKGDLGFFYHSVEEKSVVGIVKVIAEAHPDSKDTTGKWFCVDVAAVSPMPKPVSLADDQGRAASGRCRAGEVFAPFRAAGDRDRMAIDLRDGRHEKGARAAHPNRQPSRGGARRQEAGTHQGQSLRQGEENQVVSRIGGLSRSFTLGAPNGPARHSGERHGQSRF